MPSNFQVTNRRFETRRIETAFMSVLSAEGPGIRATLPYRHLGVFARAYESSKVLTALPVYAIAELGIVSMLPPGPANPNAMQDDPADAPHPLQSLRANVPLGQLGTDHAGYCSFDLSVVGYAATLQEFIRTVKEQAAKYDLADVDDIAIGLRHLWVFPFADMLLLTDALAAGDVGPDHIVLRLELDANTESPRIYGSPMTSMQSPGILDWRISPTSFTLSSALLIGQDGCETLLPANLATQVVRFRQVVRLADRRDSQRENERDRAARIGKVIEYSSEWFSIGHSLGRIEYSLPLAPAEKVKIAIVDWSRSDSAKRDEKTKLSEQLTHDQNRNRSLTETVHGVLSELQEGSNFQAGAALSGGGGASIGVLSLGAGLAGAIGGGTADSSGTHDVQAETMQQIADAFHQASSAIRELESTVVMQVDQGETSNVQTRTVANYNHGHALTILYYEVLRHFRLVTRVANERNALIVDYSDWKPDYKDYAYLLDRRMVFEAALLDERLRPYFDLLEAATIAKLRYEEEKKKWADLKKNPDPGDAQIQRLEVTFTTGDDGTDGDPYLDLKMKNGVTLWTNQIGPNDNEGKPRRMGTPGFDNFESGDVDTFSLSIVGPPTVRWGDIRGFVVGLDDGGDWKIAHIKLRGFTGDGTAIVLFDQELNVPLPNDAVLPELIVIGPPPPAPKPPEPTMRAFLPLESEVKLSVLVNHLKANEHHYLRALWLSEDPNDRAVRFAGKTFRGEPLMDWIDNRALEVLGDAVAFPIFSGRDRALDRVPEPVAEPGELYVEQLLTLPTRGIFAEARLGHCNANEFKDDRRFWDWQTSPIPDDAPAITGADAGSRYQAPTGTSPTAFPQSLVNIVNPQSLPDPTGLTSAMAALSTPGIFRDMSGTKETAALLGKLSDNATKLAETGLKGAQQQGMIDQIRNASELTPQQKSDLMGEYLTGQVKQSAPPPTTPSISTDGGTTTPTETPTPSPTPAPTPSPTGVVPPAVPPKAVEQPKPKKPAGDVATKVGGLGFLFNFRRAVVGTPVDGKAMLRITPKSTKVTSEGEYDDRYTPGVTIGPPVKGVVVPKVFSNFPILDSAIDIMTADATAPGEIRVEADYKVAYVPKATLVTAVFHEDESRVNLVDSTFHLSGTGVYEAPKSGNVVIVDVSPKVVTVSYEVSTEKKTIEEYTGEVGAEVIISAKGSAKSGGEAGGGDKRTLTLTYMTGGLDVVQTNKAT
jgi:hypothetical protein